jgi:methionyl-tRNA formyltransferase
VLQATRQGLIVQAGSGMVQIHELKPENRGAMTGIDFINGTHVKEGMSFGNG